MIIMQVLNNILKEPKHELIYDFISFKGLSINLMEGTLKRDNEDEFLLCIQSDYDGRVYDYMFVNAKHINPASYMTADGNVVCRFHNLDKNKGIKINDSKEEFVIKPWISIVRHKHEGSDKYILLLKNHEHLKVNSFKNHVFNEDRENVVYIDDVEFYLFTHYFSINKTKQNMAYEIYFSKTIDTRFQIQVLEETLENYEYGDSAYNAIDGVVREFQEKLKHEELMRPQRLYELPYDTCIYRYVKTKKDIFIKGMFEQTKFSIARRQEREGE